MVIGIVTASIYCIGANNKTGSCTNLWHNYICIYIYMDFHCWATIRKPLHLLLLVKVDVTMINTGHVTVRSDILL